MKITELKTYGGERTLQACQCLAVALREDSGDIVAIYDESNGHWLSLSTREEIGYLDHIENERILAVTWLRGGAR